MAYLPPLNGGRINVSIASNTTGSSSAGAVSTGTVVFAGGNNVTLSQSTGVNGATISFNAGGGGIALYDGAHSISSGTASIAAAGALTASITNQTLNLSVPQTSSVVGGGIVNLSTNGSSVTISAPAFSAGISSTIGNTAGNTGTVSNQLIFAGGNNITLSQSTTNTGATLTISAANQSNQTLSFSAGSQSTLTATGTFDARSFYLNGVGAAKVGFSQSSVFVSVSNQTVESQSIGMHTSTAGGGTGGTSGSASGGQIQYNFYAGSNVTLSQSVNGASGSLSIYGGAGGAGGGVALYDGANSITSGTARFSNSNGVSFGINGQTITGSVAAQSNQTLGMYVLNNSVTNAQSSTSTLDARSISLTNYGALSAGFSGGSMQLSVPATSNLVGTNGISISSNGSTISVQPARATAYVNMLPISTAAQSWGALGVSNGSAWFFPVSIAQPVVFDALRVVSNLSFVSSSASGAQSITQSFGLYSMTGSTLSQISSNTIGYSITNSSTSATMSFATSTGTGGYGYGTLSTQGTAAIQGSFGTGVGRMIDLQFGNTMTLSAGMYWLGLARSESTSNAAIGIGQSLLGNVYLTAPLGVIGSSSNAATSVSSIRMPFHAFGPYGASTNALPSSVSISSIVNSITVLPLMTFIST